MSRRPRRDAQRNRQLLLDAAAETFAVAGVGAPLEAIADRAGVSIGTLYNHFVDRDHLVDAVISEALGRLTEVADHAAGIDDPWDGLETLLVGTCQLQASDRAVADILGRSYPPTNIIDAACAHLMDRFVEIIERGRRAGVVRDDFTIDDVGPIMWSNARLIEAGSTDNPGAWRRHLGFVLDGLRSGSGRHLACG